MTAAATPVGITAEPGTLRPRAVATIAALFSARARTLVTWRIAIEIGDEFDVFYTLRLLRDMAELGLVERVGVGTGVRARWRLIVEGPVPPELDAP